MKMCSVSGCNKKHLSKGLCSAHYYRAKRNGSPLILKNESRSKYSHCKADGCTNEVKTKGLCSMHYTRFYVHGDTDFVGDRSIPLTFVIDENGCFNCTSHHKHKFGYSYVNHDGKRTMMHRKVYEEMFGDIPQGFVVRHKCDNASCINPEHLEIGTTIDNINDKLIRGRQPKGEECKSSKLKEYQVIEIIECLNNKEKNVDIAKKYRISEASVRAIKKGTTWKHITRF